MEQRIAISEIDELALRTKIIEVARTWLDTPFDDNQGLKHCGVDCAHLLVRVAVEAGVCEPFNIPYYSPQIYLHRKDRTYLDTIMRYAHEVEEKDVKPGDFVLYAQAGSFTHGGIIERWPESIIHPIRPHGVICSDAREGFLQRRPHKFFSLFTEN